MGYKATSSLVKPYYLDTLGTRPVPMVRRSSDMNSDIKSPLDWLQMALSGSMPSVSGITVTPLKAMGVATVYACVRVLSDTIGSLPLELWQRPGRQRDLALKHPLFNVLNLRPNAEMSSTDLRCAMQANVSLLSNGYSEILRDSDGDVVGLYPIESRRMDVRRDSKTKKIVYQLTDSQKSFAPKDVVHVRSNTFNGLYGINMTQTVRECIGLALALQDNAAKFFGNGSRPSGVLEHPASLSSEAQERLKEQFDKAQSGEGLYKTMVLEEGLKWAKERSENKDSQFLEAKEAQNLEICRVFGVPPHKVGIISGAGKTNMEEENLGFVTDTIRPICVKWEQELDIKVLTEEERDQGYCCRFDLDALTRGNITARFNSYAIGRQWGFYSQNDVRAKENLPPITAGDTYLQPLNMADHTKADDILQKGGKAVEQKEEGSQKKV